MKSRSYEKNLIVGLIMILFFIVFFISLVFIMTYKIEDYQVFSCSLVKYDLVCFSHDKKSSQNNTTPGSLNQTARKPEGAAR